MKVLVLGSTGMLGAAVLRQLTAAGLDVMSTSRRPMSDPAAAGTVHFDAAEGSLDDLLDVTGNVDFIVNAVGVIKSHIKDGVPADEVAALRVNSLFPHELARFAEFRGIKVIQIATDCVYSGDRGSYVESAPHDALDVYGKTKSLGEVKSLAMMHIRNSIIGREIGRSTSLTEWVLGQERGAEISGYVNHRWNGVTTEVFGRLCVGIIENNAFRPGLQHFLPANVVTKNELVAQIAQAGKRSDIRIVPVDADYAVDRSLATSDPARNRELWSLAGFGNIPTVQELVSTLARW